MPKQRIEDYYRGNFSLEDHIKKLFGRVRFYNKNQKGGSIERKNSSLKYKSPLRPKNVDPTNKEQVERCFSEKIAYATMLEVSSSSPFTSPLAQRTHKEQF